YRQCALVERPCPCKVALGVELGGEAVKAPCCAGMLGAERLLADRQRALAERPRPRKVALGVEQGGEVVEARRRVGMLRAERVLADRQCIAQQRVMNHYYAAVRRELKSLRGKEVVTTGDGLLATFDTPATGIRCATAIREAVRTLGLEIRVGLHAGEYKV